MADIPLHDLNAEAADLPLFVGQIETMTELIQTPEPDRHTFYEVLWLRAGAGQHHIDFESYAIRPHTMFFVAPGQVHFWSVPRRSTGYVLLFSDDVFHLDSTLPGVQSDLIFATVLNPPPVLHATTDQAGVFDQLFQRLLLEYTQHGAGWRVAMRALIQLVLVEAQRGQGQTQSSTAAVTAGTLLTRRFRALVEQQYAQFHTVQSYAQTLGVTTGYLSEAVRAATGLPAGEVIRRRLVLEAKRRLAQTDATVDAISMELCFNSASYFSRFFRRETGSSPDRFRRDFREKYPLSHA